MRIFLLWVGTLAAWSSATPLWAQSPGATTFARVLRTTPVVTSVATTEHHCQNTQVLRGYRTSGTGVVLGAVVGGVVGHALSSPATHARPPRHGTYRHDHRPSHFTPSTSGQRQASTVLGALAGGWIGHQIEASQASGTPVYETQQHCTPTTAYRQQITGYDVVYSYNDQIYSTRMDNDPGAWLAMSVAPQHPQPTQGTQPLAHDSINAQEPIYSTRFYGPSGTYRAAPPGTWMGQPNSPSRQ